MAGQFHHLRARYYDADPASARALRGYHLTERETAGLLATETYHPPRFTIPSHSHDLPSFYLVLEGALTEFSRSSERALGAYSVVFTPAGHIHRNTFHDRGGRCLLVELTPAWTDRLTTAGMSFQGPLVAGASELALLGIKLRRELHDADPVAILAAEGLALEILAGFARDAQQLPSGDCPDWLLRARDLLHDRFAESLGLAEIAAAAGVHPVHLARVFRKRFRCTPGEYQRRLRVEHASRELATTRRSLAAIAHSAGFADQAHFSRVFRDRTGWTPARFRAACSIG
jgi:AraC family transcriptional regulator